MIIEYGAGYKYQLKRTYTCDTGIERGIRVSTMFIDLDEKGKLTIREGYAWDGPSGPTIDTPTFMRGSLVHDALYQLMRTSHIAHDFRKQIDKLLRQMCLEDGMPKIRAWWVYQGVRIGGDMAAHKPKRSFTAP